MTMEASSWFDECWMPEVQMTRAAFQFAACHCGFIPAHQGTHTAFSTLNFSNPGVREAISDPREFQTLCYFPIKRQDRSSMICLSDRTRAQLHFYEHDPSIRGEFFKDAVLNT